MWGTSNFGPFYNQPQNNPAFLGFQNVELVFPTIDNWTRYITFSSIAPGLKRGREIFNGVNGDILVNRNSSLISRVYLLYSESFTAEILDYSITKVDIFHLEATGFAFPTSFGGTYNFTDNYFFDVTDTPAILFNRAKFYLGGDRDPIFLADAIWTFGNIEYQLTVTQDTVYIGIRADAFFVNKIYTYTYYRVWAIRSSNGQIIEYSKIYPIFSQGGIVAIDDPVVTGTSFLDKEDSWTFPTLTTPKTYTLIIPNNINNNVRFPYTGTAFLFSNNFYEKTDAIFYGAYRAGYNEDLRILRSQDAEVYVEVKEPGQETKYMAFKTKPLNYASAIVLINYPYIIKK